MKTPFGNQKWEQLSLEQQIQVLFKHMPPADEDEAELMIAALVRARNASPLGEFGGLTPDQVHDLISGDWAPTTPGVQLRAVIPPERVAGNLVVRRAHVLLGLLGDDGTPATPKGYLNRKFVARLVPRLDLADDLLESLRRHCKVINEHDVRPLEELRIVLGLAGLVRRHRGRFVPTRKGRELRAVGRAGDLYRLLLLTWLQRFNLGFTDLLPEVPEFQHTVGFGLYRLGQLGEGWHDLARQARGLVLPAVWDRIPQRYLTDVAADLVRLRLLGVLQMFGLVELRGDGRAAGKQGQREEFRRTALFGEVLGFGV